MLDSIDYTLEEDLNHSNEKDNLINIDNKREFDSTASLYDQFNSKNENDLELVVSMGYEEKMVKKVYILLKPNDINEAIDFLTKENGIYQHDFMKRYGKNDICFICGESAKNHINYEPEKKSLLDLIRDSFGKAKNENKSELIDFSKNKDSILIIDDDKKENENKNKDDKNNEIVSCVLCFEELSEEEKEKNFIKCKHMFCSDCYLNYFQDKIDNNKVDKITCMQHKCSVELDDDFIISHLNGNHTLIEKYKKFKLRSNLYNDPNVKFCPIKDCESYAKKEGDNKYVTCLNGHKFCFNCSKPWHGKKKCQDEIDKDFKKWKKNKVIKRCPKCKMWTEKNLGCNHMTCAQCHYQWCWICGGKYTERHFQFGGGCAGLQFTQSNLFNNCFCLFLFKIWVIFYQMIVYIFILPIYGFMEIIKYDTYYYNNCFVFTLYPTWFFWIIANFGFFLSLGSILSILTLFLGPFRGTILEMVLEL